jgi:hypothetical protein
MKGRVSDQSANMQGTISDGDLIKAWDTIYVNEMRRLCKPKRHNGHQALPTRQDTPTLRRPLRQQRYRIGHRARRVVLKGTRLHDRVFMTVPVGVRLYVC